MSKDSSLTQYEWTQLDNLVEVLSEEIACDTIERGFKEANQQRNVGEVIALLHSEVSELLEAYRHSNPPDKHCALFSSADIEAADILIRLLDFAHEFELDLIWAMKAKLAYGKTRPYKHGKNF